MQTTSSTFIRVIPRRAATVSLNLSAIVGLLATLATAHPSSGSIIPIGCLEIRKSGDAVQITLRDDADDVVSDLALPVTDQSTAGALLHLPKLPRGYVLTVQPVGHTAGDATLYRGDSLLVLQPPLIGDTDTWQLEVHAPTAHAGVTTIVAAMLIEVDHREANEACNASADLARDARRSSFDASLIVVRIKPVPPTQPSDEWHD